jgi:hypothetical protein
MELCAVDQTLSDDKEWFHPESDEWYERRKTQYLVRPSRAAEYSGDLAPRFEMLRASWHREYGASSSFTVITSCPSYREIVGYGKKALPFIIQDLERRPEPDFWFDALTEITKVNPIAEKDRGYARKMAKVWVKWWRENKHRYG